MRLMKIFALCLAFLLSPLASTQAVAATPAEIAAQVREQWAKNREAYLASVQPYAGQAAYASQVQNFTAALDKAGAALENYLTLKLASPPTPAAQLTPAVDQLTKDMGALRVLYRNTTGPLVNVLGTALSQHSATTQTALKNMQ